MISLNTLSLRSLFCPAAVTTLLLCSAAHARPAADIEKDLDALKWPVFDDDRYKAIGEPYRAEFRKTFATFSDKKAVLTRELFDTDPENPRLLDLMRRRWAVKEDTFDHEMDEVIAAGKPAALVQLAEGLKISKSFFVGKVRTDPARFAEIQKNVEAYVAKYPDEPMGHRLVGVLQDVAPESEKEALTQRVLRDYPKTPAADRIRGEIFQRDAVGKPFHLSFNDATTGTAVSVEALKGKVVVIDFWATWCGPCLAEMPKMKTLYDKYKDKGVEFIGVSLDDPEESSKGLTKLKNYVSVHGITWPQYYQGNGFDSAFSKAMGISGIPTLFILDKQGNLHSTSARGKLDTLIPELLAK